MNMKENNITKKERNILIGKRSKRLKEQKATKRKRKREKPNNFECYECDKTFIKEKLFQIHCIDVHENRHCFECNECEKSYTAQSYLSGHIRKIHDKVSSIFQTSISCKIHISHC